MKKVYLIIMLAAFMGSVAYTTWAEAPLPPPDAQALWTYMTKTRPYQEWHFLPGHEGLYQGKSPHGAYLKVYVNDPGYFAAKEKSNMPPGTIIVKENYAKDGKTLMAVTPMYKVKGYNPQAGDWFWVKYGPRGQVMKAGKVQGCIRCHGTQKDHDWRFLR